MMNKYKMPKPLVNQTYQEIFRENQLDPAFIEDPSVKEDPIVQKIRTRFLKDDSDIRSQLPVHLL